MGEIEEPTVQTECELEEDEDFGAWLKFVSQCLKGNPNMTSARRKKEEKFEAVKEKEGSEEERCLRVVRSVLDEQTVLEMATDFLQMTRGQSCKMSQIWQIYLCRGKTCRRSCIFVK